MSKKTYECDWCKKSFEDYPSQRETRNRKKFFCCRECKYEWNKTLPGYWSGKNMSEEAKLNMRRNHADFSGSKNGRWKGGKRIDKDGYVLILKPEHPHSDYHGYVREHRLVMEKKLNRILDPEEVVHHMNHIKTDNRVENLILLSSGSEHMKLHAEERKNGKNP